MESRYQSIEMGSENIERMKRDGAGRFIPFSLFLTDCSVVTDKYSSRPWTYLQVTFDGAGDDGLFKVKGSTDGVALVITDRHGNTADPGKWMPYVRIDNQNIRLDYTLQLRTTHQEIHVGEYSSIIKFRVSYF